MVVFLIGYMGSGKSTIGRRLSKRLGWKFVDMDKYIETKCDMSINEIFEIKGEEWFRDVESAVLCDFSEQEDVIVATGGGAPCFGDNMQIMNRLGLTIYLSVLPSELYNRLQYGLSKRPKIKDLSDEELYEFIESNLMSRAPFYNTSSIIIDCDGFNEVAITTKLEECLAVTCK